MCARAHGRRAPVPAPVRITMSSLVPSFGLWKRDTGRGAPARAHAHRPMCTHARKHPRTRPPCSSPSRGHIVHTHLPRRMCPRASGEARADPPTPVTVTADTHSPLPARSQRPGCAPVASVAPPPAPGPISGLCHCRGLHEAQSPSQLPRHKRRREQRMPTMLLTGTAPLPRSEVGAGTGSQVRAVCFPARVPVTDPGTVCKHGHSNAVGQPPRDAPRAAVVALGVKSRLNTQGVTRSPLAVRRGHGDRDTVRTAEGLPNVSKEGGRDDEAGDVPGGDSSQGRSPRDAAGLGRRGASSAGRRPSVGGHGALTTEGPCPTRLPSHS